ncbi:hypothetical protein KEM56_004128, partial [Ascosphaera pollenicola]
GESRKKHHLLGRVKSLIKTKITPSATSSTPASTAPAAAASTTAKNEPTLIGKKLEFTGKGDTATITKTYDHPVALQPFPYGYYHDLSLISCSSSHLSCAPGSAMPVDGFTSDYDKILDGRLQVCVTRYRVAFADPDTLPAGAGNYPAHVITKPAVIEGCEYLWLPPIASTMKTRATVSLMWRAEENSEAPRDWTSRVLVVDTPGGGAGLNKAVVLQNYGIRLGQPPGNDGGRRVKRNLEDGEGVWPGRETVKYLDGGFLVPEDVRGCEVEIDGVRGRGMDAQMGADGGENSLSPLIKL